MRCADLTMKVGKICSLVPQILAQAVVQHSATDAKFRGGGGAIAVVPLQGRQDQLPLTVRQSLGLARRRSDGDIDSGCRLLQTTPRAIQRKLHLIEMTRLDQKIDYVEPN